MTIFLKYSFLLLFISLNYEKTTAQSTQNEYTGREYTALKTRLAKGWNTWNYKSVMSHVLLPEGFSINLSLKDQSGKLLEDALIGREHYGSKERVSAGPRAYDGSYTEIEVEWHSIQMRVQTASLNNELFLLISPLKWSTGDSLLISPRMQWGKKGEIRIDGNLMIGKTETNTIKVYVNIERSTTTGNYINTSLDKKIAISSAKPRSVAEVEKIIEKARLTFESARPKFKESRDTYDALQTVLAWTTIYDPNNNRVINPVSRTFSNDWVLFGWDTYFAAYMLAVDNKDLAYANAIAMTKDITSKGFIPNVSQRGHKSEDRSEPQVGSIMVREIYRKYPEKWFLQEVYDGLLSWNRWRAANRDVDGYLVHGSDPYDYGDNKSRSATLSGKMKAAKWESGMDNSPMWDGAVFDSTRHLMLLADVGLMGLFIADCHSLSEIAAILGKTDDVKELSGRAEKYSKKLQTLWNDQFGLYLNKDLVTGEFSYRLSPTLFYPLLAKVATVVFPAY